MRQLIVIIFSLICFSGFSQTYPVATIPSPRGDSAFAQYGYLKALTLGIDAVGDTMIRPRLAGSSRTWIHGGNTEVWKWDGTKWVLTGTSGGAGGGTVTNVSATNTYALSWSITNPTTTPNLTATLDTSKLLSQNHFYNSIDSLIISFNNTYVKYTDTASMLSHYVRRVLAGTNVTVDNTNPQYPIVSSTAGGGGTVTSFSSGNLSPLFTTSVATATTTPAQTFALSTATAWRVFSTNASTTPAYNQLKAEHLNTTYSNGNMLITDGSGNLSWTTAGLSSTLADGNIWIGNASNVATPQIPTGDVSITNAGVTSVNLTAQRVPFGSTVNKMTTSSNLYYDSSAFVFHSNGAVNGFGGFYILNSSNGTIASSGVQVTNDVGTVTSFGIGSSGYVGTFAKNRSVLAGSKGVSVISNVTTPGTDDVRIYAGGSTKKPSIFKANNHLLLGDTTDNTSNANNILQVFGSGTIRDTLWANNVQSFALNGSGDSIILTLFSGNRFAAYVGTGSAVTVSSYGKNATRDSTILLLSNGTRYAAKDSVGTGGGLSSIVNRTYLGNVSGSTATPDTLHYSVFNVKDFGLVDDSSTDNTTALRALVAQVPDGASIYFPGGGLGYKFTDSILINKALNIYGDGVMGYQMYTIANTPQKGATNLFLSVGNKNLFAFRASASNLNPPVHIHDLTLKSTVTTPTTSNGIIIYDNVAQHVLNNLTIYGFYNNINVVSANSLLIDHCNIIGAIQDGIILGNNVEVDYGEFKISHCQIYSGLASTTVARGIYFKGGGGVDIHDNIFNATATLTVNTQLIYGIYTDMSQGATSEIKIVNNFFDNFQTNAIRLRNYSGTRIPNVLIAHNQIAPLTGSSAQAGIDINGFNNFIISDIIGQSAVRAYPLINLDSCTGVTIGPTSYIGYNARYASTANVTSLNDLNVTSSFVSTGVAGGQTVTGGTGASENLTLQSTSNATKGKINTGNLYVVGTALSGGSATSNFFNVTGTLNATNSAEADGVHVDITSAGSSSQNQIAANFSLLAGYTGSLTTEAFAANNYAVGTGNVIAGVSALRANVGNLSGARATATSSTNIGGFQWAIGGQKNVGVVGDATLSQYNNAAGISIGVVGFAQRANSSAIHLGGYFGLQSAAPTFESAALIADNGAETSPIFLLRDNGTKVLTVADGGAMRIGDATSPTDKLEVTGNFALTTAGNKLKIATGSNASTGTSGAMTAGTITISTTAVTASSIIHLTHASSAGTIGILSVGTITAGTSFVINSSSATDTSTVNWWIVN